MPEPFTISVPRATIDDLHRRLDNVRWPAGVVDSGGLPLERVRELVDYWRNVYDWYMEERDLNLLHHFRANGIHFVHERARNPNATPLLLLHGWPGSFIEFREVIARLKDAFHLIVPSLPGYGFSDPPTSAGMSNSRMADVFAELMTSLGYERFGVQGGDWGAGIGTWLARKHPARVVGLHLNYIPGSFSPHAPDPTGEERAFLRSRDEWVAASGAYGQVQRTRPLTLSYGLSDSPVGLAAWITEMFVEWADPRSEIHDREILTNVMIYWITNTIGSSVRLYLESVRTPLAFAAGERLAVPAAVARFPLEAPFPPRSWVERVYNVRRWTVMDRGGHFAALEQPEMLANDIRAFFLTHFGTA
ncbi:MAG: epoxide hydrolase family protein [Thermoanaerobaculia bacterium]